MSDQAALRVRDLRKTCRNGVEPLRGIDFDVRPGALLARRVRSTARIPAYLSMSIVQPILLLFGSGCRVLATPAFRASRRTL